MSFIYYTQSKLVFGVGSQNQLEALLRENAATSILLVYSGDYVFDLGIHDVINQAARNIGANLIENGDVVPNPHIDLVRNLIDQARAADVDFILAVGGASSFDTARRWVLVLSTMGTSGIYSLSCRTTEQCFGRRDFHDSRERFRGIGLRGASTRT